MIRECGAMQEIGKRAVWASQHQAAAAPHVIYGVIAIDTDWAESPAWMHCLLHCLKRRADEGRLTSLLLRSFDLETQVELAFRTLQSGSSTGKIVIRVAQRSDQAVTGAQVITGGTGGLGLLTARWLAQRGASRIVLASRSGKRASASAYESKCLAACTAVEKVVQQCDASDESYVQRLVACTVEQLKGI